MNDLDFSQKENNKFKILIVDDAPKNIQLLANILSKESYQLGYAQNGMQALEIVKKSSFDLILLDVMMPELDGFQVCHQLKSDANTKNIPVIFLTAKTDEESIIKGFESGGVDYLTKPFNSAELKIRVKTHLEASNFKKRIIEINNQLVKEIEGRQEAELKLSIVASETDNGVMIFDSNGILEWQNISIGKMFEGTSVKDQLTNGKHIVEISQNADIEDICNECTQTGESKIYETEYFVEGNGSRWMQTTMTPIFNEQRKLEKIITIDSDITKIKKAEGEIKMQNEKITDSIRYALRIQHAILPPLQKLEQFFPESFILLRPKDIVSGDFFWIHETEENIYIAAVDCTGHGVPGAFMSIISNNLLNRAILQQKLEKPSDILDFLNQEVVISLNKDSSVEVKDGMDIALCAFNRNGNSLQYAGASNSLILIRDGELIEIRADSSPIGGDFMRGRNSFTNHLIEIKPQDRLYMFSDGYVDQFGGEDKRKFFKKNFRKLLVDSSTKTIRNQREHLKQVFKEWKGSLEQIDDVLIVGIQI